MSARDWKPNEKMTKIVQGLGYCCVYGFFAAHDAKKYSHQRIANKLVVGLSTVQYNRRKIRNGEIKCAGAQNCQCKKPTSA